jgi:hypothetical protein
MEERSNPENPRLKFHFHKSTAFRVVHADGAWGGLTPRLDVFMTFYSERPPIPQVIVHEITDRGLLGQEVRSEREAKDGIIREAEVGVTMDLSVAKSLVAWLQEKIREAEKLRSTVASEATAKEETIPQ